MQRFAKFDPMEKGSAWRWIPVKPRPGAGEGESRFLFITNFLSFLIASSGAFLPRNDMLLIGNDGEYTRNSVVLLSHFADLIPALSMAPFEGMGTLFAFNPLISPSLLPIAVLNNELGLWLAFMICAGLLFFSTYLLGRALGMGRGVSLLAAWGLPPLCLPYQSWLNLYLTFNLNPLAGDNVSFTMIGVALLSRGYTSPCPHWFGLALALVVIWLFLAQPLWLVLLLPSVLPVCIGIMASHSRRPHFFRWSVWLLLPSLLFVALGGTPYLLGLYSDTAVAFFPQEMNRGVAHSLRLFSVAGATGSGIHPIGAMWIGLALGGVALTIRQSDATRRMAGLSVLVAIVLFAGYGIAYLMSSSWVLPYPIYFEFFIWPYYALFAAYAVGELVNHFAPRFRKAYPVTTEQFEQALQSPLRVIGLSAVAGAVLSVLLASHPFAIRPNDLIRPPTDTLITKALSAESSIAPGARFRGYAAELTGFGGPDGPPTDWFRLLPETNEAFLKFGNTHRIPYLWRFAIPTIEAYSQAVEPTIYGLLSRLLDRPQDGQVRNITIVTLANIPLLESLGVRFLITDYSLPPPARLTTELVVPPMSHFVFELPDPNYGGYSPTQVVTARDASDLLRRIGDANFDFRNFVVLNEPLDRILQPAERSSSIIVRGGWRIQARSAGTSLLLLPLQFSNCLSLSERQQDAGKVIALRRANLAATALVFEGAIDVTIALRVSPFLNVYCRLRDAREMKEFGLANLPRSTIPVPGRL
jgi:hypothetical protein